MGISSYDESIHRDDQDFRISDELFLDPIHQHLFCIRLDWDLDNGDNQLFETNIETLLVSKYTHVASTSLKKREHEAKHIDISLSFVWKITLKLPSLSLLPT